MLYKQPHCLRPLNVFIENLNAPTVGFRFAAFI